MDYIFDDWKKVLEDFQQCVSKDLEEIHKQKAAVQQIKTDIFDCLDSGRYIVDEQRIVISAPEIVIGNVDKSGQLKSTGKVIIRGSEIDVEGAGSSGIIIERAPIIRQTAVDPGVDGNEDVVYPHSSITSQARSITLESSNAKDVFSEEPAVLGESGVRIHADQTLQVEASKSGDIHKESLEELIKALKDEKEQLKKLSDAQKKDIDGFFKDLKKVLGKEEEYTKSTYNVRVNTVEMERLRDKVEDITPSLYQVTQGFIHSISRLAEVNRQITALEKEKGETKTGKDFRDTPSEASLTLQGESIGMLTYDGDGRLCTNDAAGIIVHTPHMGISMLSEEGTLLEASDFHVSAESVDISTGNPKKDNSEMTATGSVHILSKDIVLESMDYQKKDDLMTEKGLAADGKITLAAKTIEATANKPANVERDKEGKITKGTYTAEGDIILKSKNISIETVDYEISGGQPKTKALAQGSKMLLLAETMNIGMETKDFKSKKIDTNSEEILSTADKTFKAQQGEDKASVKMADGKLNLASSANEVKGKTEFKDPIKGPEATMDKVKASSSFKSPNISDGM